MDDGEASTWIRRTNFSRTCHRLIGSIPYTETRQMTLQELLNSNVNSEIYRNQITNKTRAASPLPWMEISDSFKEAKSDIKPFSTPPPERLGFDRGIKALLDRQDSGPSTRKVSGSRVNAMGVLGRYFIDSSKLSYGGKFSHGVYSQLYRGEYNGKIVALKIIEDKNGDRDLADRLDKQFIKEATLSSRLSHPNVVKFVGVTTGNCIIMEYVPQGSLRSYLQNLEQKILPLQQIVKFGLDIARGMEYIHSRSIIHCDLKPGNILIDNDFNLKIADFGISCEEDSCENFREDVGTLKWMAPEVIKRSLFGRKADVYSFGIVLWEMIAGDVPYKDMTPFQAAFEVMLKNTRPIIPRDCPAAMKKLIEKCWSSKADKRPEFWQIVKVLEQFEKILEREGRLNLNPNKICPELKKIDTLWNQIFKSVRGSSNNNLVRSSMLKPRFA